MEVFRNGLLTHNTQANLLYAHLLVNRYGLCLLPDLAGLVFVISDKHSKQSCQQNQHLYLLGGSESLNELRILVPEGIGNVRCSINPVKCRLPEQEGEVESNRGNKGKQDDVHLVVTVIVVKLLHKLATKLIKRKFLFRCLVDCIDLILRDAKFV